MSNPLISIIVPVYNVEGYLPYCLDCLCSQTYEKLQILLVDDGSTDSSLDICKEYARKDDRCCILHKENGGLGSARNYGLKYAKGDYISFVDSDDFVSPLFIDILYHALINGDYDFAMVAYKPTFGRRVEFDDKKADCYVLNQEDLVNGLYNHMPKGLSKWNDILFRVVWNKLYKKELLQDLLFSNTPIAEDFEYNNQVFLRSRKAVFKEVKLYYYFSRPDSLARKPDGKRLVWQILVHFRCLNQIPVDSQEYRSVSLIKLYKAILSIRFFMMKKFSKESRKEFNQTVRNILKTTNGEIFRNNFIPMRLKLLLLFFLYIPFSYAWFMIMCEKKAQISNALKR